MRFWGVLLVMLLAAPALAGQFGLAVFVDEADSSCFTAKQRESYLGSWNRQRDYDMNHLRQILDAFGADYRVIPVSGTTTNWARIGVIPSGSGFDTCAAGLVARFMGVGATAGTCRLFAHFHPESLTLTAFLPTIPFMMTGSNSGASMPGGNAMWADAATCTTGASGTGPVFGALMAAACKQRNTMYWQIGYPNERLWEASYGGGWGPDATAPAGGIRNLLEWGGHNLSDVNACGDGSFCVQCDAPQSQNQDTMRVWVRLNQHVIGAKPIIFDWGTGRGPCPAYGFTAPSTDPQQGTIGCEGSTQDLVIGLSLLDSLSGHRIFTRTVKAALVIDGACTFSDSTNESGAIDSLKAWEVPATVAYDCDSASVYVAQMVAWNRYTQAHFAPQVWRTIGECSATVLVDPLGSLRNRSMLGPLDGAANDTSVYSNASRMHSKARTLWGERRLSRFLFAFDDDWTPLNVFGVSRGMDSLLYVLGRAGFSGLRTTSQVDYTGSDPAGYPFQQGLVREPFGGQTFKVLTHSGYSIIGSRMQDVRADSVPPYGPTTRGIPWINTVSYELARSWAGLFYWRSQDYDYSFPQQENATYSGADLAWEGIRKPVADATDGFSRGAIIYKHAADFSGNEKPGWWQVKAMTSLMRCVNRMNGRPIMSWAYPEDVDVQ